MKKAVFILGSMAIIAISHAAMADENCCNADCSCQWERQGTAVSIKAIGNDVVMDDWSQSGPWGTDITSVTIEGNFDTLGARAFKNATTLESVDIKGSIKNINNAAFHNTALTQLDLPDGLETIAREAFSKNSQLEHVTIPDTVTSIGAWAFQHSAIKEMEIPNGVEEIGSGAFHDCTSLEKLTIPDSVETFSYDDLVGYGDWGHLTFADGNLKELIISSDKLEMYKNAGGNIPNLTAIHCIDGADKCRAVLDTLGISVPTVDRATKMVENSDGSYTVQNYDGTLAGYKGKRIYTVNEANNVTGKKNTLKIRYK